MELILSKYRNNILAVLPSAVLALALLCCFSSCGEQPASPPEIAPGDFQLTVYLDSSWTDGEGILHPNSILADGIDSLIIDDSLCYYNLPNPAEITDIIPGYHRIDVYFEDYNDTFFDTVFSGELACFNRTMSLLAPDFTLPAMRYDLELEQVVYDTISLAELQGKVVLIFFFSWT
ncbi:hypothetical protein ISS30_08425 [bacterium]|nr:hypothetical protein [FCB group bacterium]MBL7191708.1 hypothetical protein [bacterium]